MGVLTAAERTSDPGSFFVFYTYISIAYRNYRLSIQLRTYYIPYIHAQLFSCPDQPIVLVPVVDAQLLSQYFLNTPALLLTNMGVVL